MLPKQMRYQTALHPDAMIAAQEYDFDALRASRPCATRACHVTRQLAWHVDGPSGVEGSRSTTGRDGACSPGRAGDGSELFS